MNLNIKKLPKIQAWFLPVLMAFIMRLIGINSSSIWHDEGYTMWLLRYDFFEIIARTARDVHPPGYYLIAKLWIEVFGNSEFAIRFLSLIFSVGIVYLIYRIINDIWSSKAAFWASMFVALSPFMIRFGQEARMYGVVAFFTTLATFYFVKFIKEKNQRYLYFYVPATLIAIYTQYYAFFVIIAHWVILSFYTKGFWQFKWRESLKDKVGVFSKSWWLANGLILVGYAPWFPVAYAQVTRVSESYWIKPEWITARTIPGNIFQFAFYDSLSSLYYWAEPFGTFLYWVVALILILGGLYLLRIKNMRKKLISSIFIFGFMPMILVFVISKIASPIYQDRYFPFSAVAVLSIWAILVSEIRNKYYHYVFLAFFIIIFVWGNYRMQTKTNHEMRELANVIKDQSQKDDLFVSGELYTHLDGSYYLGYGNFYLLSKPVNGYGETSLYYDQQEKYILSEEEVVTYNRFWLVGKTGRGYWEKEFLNNYSEITYFDKGGLKATLFTKD